MACKPFRQKVRVMSRYLLLFPTGRSTERQKRSFRMAVRRQGPCLPYLDSSPTLWRAMGIKFWMSSIAHKSRTYSRSQATLIVQFSELVASLASV